MKTEKLHRLPRSDLQLVWVDAEPQAVKKIHCDLGVLDGLLLAASHNDDVVDIHHTSDFSAAEVLDCRLQKLVCNARCRERPKGIPAHSYFMPLNMNQKNLQSYSAMHRCM